MFGGNEGVFLRDEDLLGSVTVDLASATAIVIDSEWVRVGVAGELGWTPGAAQGPPRHLLLRLVSPVARACVLLDRRSLCAL